MANGKEEASRTQQRRVRRPKDKEPLIKKLVDDEHVFDTYRDLLVFAAGLGFAKSRQRPFEQSSEPIPWSVFSGVGLDGFVNMLAAVTDDDYTILDPERYDERLKVFEEYANGGLEVIHELLAHSSRPSLDVLVQLMMEAGQEMPKGAVAGETEAIASELSW